MATFKATFAEESGFDVAFSDRENLKATFGEIREVSTSDYEKLFNKPSINDVELIGNKTGPELRLQNKMQELTVAEIEKILYLD